MPSHITSIWSARALDEAPDAVVAVHRDYIEAGAAVITANNYAVTPPLLAREGLEARTEELTRRAAELALRAREETRRQVRIAGSVPPLDTSYRADLVGDDAEMLASYRRIVGALAPRVDLLLCETMSSTREARAALTAARESDRPVWVSFTLQGSWQDHLPSGETVAEACEAVRPFAPDAVLVNCCGADFVTSALATLAKQELPAFGGYAHAAVVANPTRGTTQPEATPEYEPLSVDAYADTVATWLEAGASIVGGCCSTGPRTSRDCAVFSTPDQKAAITFPSASRPLLTVSLSKPGGPVTIRDTPRSRRRLIASASRTSAPQLISISAGSRPDSAHSLWITSISSARRVMSPRAGKNPSPKRAARRAAPTVWPPTTIGTPPGCTGFGFDSSAGHL